MAASRTVKRWAQTMAFESLCMLAGLLDQLHTPRAAGRVRHWAGRIG